MSKFKRPFLYLLIASTLLFTGCFIDGKIVDENGVGVSGVTVTLSGEPTRVTTTNSEGEYRFGDLLILDIIPAGSYVVIPSKSGYSFVPAGANVTITGQTVGDLDDIPGPDIAVNFTATAYVDLFWEIDAPEAHGFDPVKLQEAADWAEHPDSKESDSLIVIQDGYIVLERYWNGMDQYTPKQVWSVTKSFASTLVGIAQYQGFLDINEPVANYIPEWAGTESESVTIRNLLSGDSGRFWDFKGDFFVLFGWTPDDVTQFAIERGQQYEPGNTWQYNQMAMQCLDRVMSVATGQSTVSFAQEYLFDPLGMAHTIAELDPTGQMLLPWGISATARDMARLGHLWLNGGMWNGEQILSPEYIEEATSPNEVNPAYGYMWWLNPDGGWIQSVTLEPQEGKYLPDAPPDIFTAAGSGGQMIMVSPSENMVIVRQGDDPPGHNNLTLSSIYREIAAARNQQ